MDKRAGYYKTNLNGEMAYKSFFPSALPPVPNVRIDDDMMRSMTEAHRQLGILCGVSSRIEDQELFISMYIRKEALLSSQIEGTQATLDDIFDSDLSGNVNLEVAEVINYIKATEYSLKHMKILPVCGRLLREIHAVLLEGARGREKDPGEFRNSQNWIGPKGSTLKNARFIPPNITDMKDAISDLEIYINAVDSADPLIRIALIHYQFETIHPFLDGNGRIGRLLIILLLIEKQLLDSPLIYISYFLKRNQTEYYDRLTEVRNKGNYEQWIKFFLEVIIGSAKDAINTIYKMTRLHEKNYISIMNHKKFNKNMLELLKYIEGHPIIDIGKTAKVFNVAYNTMKTIIDRFAELGILYKNTDSMRNKSYSYHEFLKILRKDTEL